MQYLYDWGVRGPAAQLTKRGGGVSLSTGTESFSKTLIFRVCIGDKVEHMEEAEQSMLP